MRENFSSPVDVELNYQSVGQIVIDWVFELDMRSWGLKDMVATVPDQTIVVEVEVEDANGDYDHESREIKLKDVKVEVERLHEGKKRKGKALTESSGGSFGFTMTTLEIDTKRNEIVAKFQLG